ncbi:extracellular solute-binding protein [Paenibacillaceae bacterium]|nr:extracellular solute-binding protein [Paenibacillaceae bacterium]
MKKSIRLIPLLLAAMLLLTIVSACSQKENRNSGQESTAIQKTEEAAEVSAAGENETEEAEGDPSGAEDEVLTAIKQGTYKFESPVTITTVKATDSSFKFKNSETLEDNVHTQWALEELGVKIDHLWQVPGDQFGTKIRLMLTAKEKLPDVLTTQDIGLMNELIQSGLYKDITADFEKYASDKMKAIYSSHPLMWSQVTVDGKRMGLPNFANAGNDNAIMWVRQDWLDELNMEAPKTFEELETFMQALLDSKPGGQKNIIPLGVSLGSGGGHPNPLAGWLGESTWVFGPSGTLPYQWLLDETSGKIVHGSTLPAVKEGLARMRDWYDKGYISKEAGLHDENKLAELIGQGRIGAVVGPYWMGGWPIPDLETNVPGATMNPYPIPSLNGKAAARDTTFLRGAMLVRDNFEHVDALFLYLNRLFTGVNAEAGSEFEHGWAEGYEYVVKEDGNVSKQEEDIPGGRVGIVKYFLFEPRDPFMSMYKVAGQAKMLREGNLTDEEKAALGNPKTLKAAELVVEGWEQGVYVPHEFNGASTPTMQSKGGILTKLEGEAFVGMIYGKQSLEQFETFVKEWLNIGGAQMTEEANEWYNSTK